jgi:hypothetical protein
MNIRCRAVAMVALTVACAPLAARPARPIGMNQARQEALALVPQGHVVSAELEREHGKRVYSFDIRRAGKSGIEEVQIDAYSGKLVSQVHETPAEERKEKRADAKRR